MFAICGVHKYARKWIDISEFFTVDMEIQENCFAEPHFLFWTLITTLQLCVAKQILPLISWTCPVKIMFLYRLCCIFCFANLLQFIRSDRLQYILLSAFEDHVWSTKSRFMWRQQKLVLIQFLSASLVQLSG